MIVATKLGDVAQIVREVGTLVGVVVTAVTTFVVLRRTKEVHTEVRTWNESTIGENSAANESRRIEDIPRDDRTSQEQRHVDAVPHRPISQRKEPAMQFGNEITSAIRIGVAGVTSWGLVQLALWVQAFERFTETDLQINLDSPTVATGITVGVALPIWYKIARIVERRWPALKILGLSNPDPI
jgi:hypothetical protein